MTEEKGNKYFNLCSVWLPAVLENIFCIAKAKTLACLVDIPRELRLTLLRPELIWKQQAAFARPTSGLSLSSVSCVGHFHLPRWVLLLFLRSGQPGCDHSIWYALASAPFHLFFCYCCCLTVEGKCIIMFSHFPGAEIFCVYRMAEESTQRSSMPCHPQEGYQ